MEISIGLRMLAVLAGNKKEGIAWETSPTSKYPL
jgi:hypothetical protein